MKKIFLSLLILFLFPYIVLADEVSTTTTVTTTEALNESPDTGVEDYFLILGSVSIVLIITIEIINKKSIFKNI